MGCSMTRILGIALFVCALWISIEIYTEGVDGAFGGALAGASEEPAARSRHAANAFQRAYNSSENRVDRALESDDSSCSDCPDPGRRR
jgi:hypothetical protein